jgi:hypothetical protein
MEYRSGRAGQPALMKFAGLLAAHPQLWPAPALWSSSITEEKDHARQHQRSMEQGQITWRQAAAAAKTRLVDQD